MKNFFDRVFLVLLLLFGGMEINVIAQQRIIQYDRDFVFKDGVYLSLYQFKNNNPIPTSKVIFKSNKDDRDYLKIVLSNSSFQYVDSTGRQQEAKTGEIWGYCSNGTIYINYGISFSRMVIIGSLCHFVATVATKVSSDPLGYGYGSGGVGYSPYPRYVYSTQQFILDFESGRIIDFNADNMEVILQRDEALHADFIVLKRKQKRDSVFLYLRKFNDKHPIYFPE